MKYVPRAALFLAVPALLFALPWWLLVYTALSGPWFWLGTAVFLLGYFALPAGMLLGHGARQSDTAALIGDTLLGVMWVVFTWSVIGAVARGVLTVAGVDDPARSRLVAIAVAAISIGLSAWAVYEARRLPRVRAVEVEIPGLGAGLDGLRLVVVTDTHYAATDRLGWSERVVAEVNALRPDIACHAGDLADGSVEKRRAQVDPLGKVEAEYGRYYITGNHEYFGDAPGWIDHMSGLGWRPLRNEHQVITRNGDSLVLAGIDDPTGAGLPGHGPDIDAALTGADPAHPVILLAHQPKQVTDAVKAGVALQISGHTHGGQIWPFRYLVRLDQPVVAGLSRHGDHTQLYTSRGTGFWGPQLRLFAPSEITVLILRQLSKPNPV
ncbi:metallophosphoesterase [Nocardia seriolae]|uniref:Metallophosphoesterase n=1 Tax=Nocardia seriolae TaxID=37332 RepID=A0ABC9YYI3_9NOCA|nr:metallophosphoesterase [Nocardia seriolae]APB00375.1 Transmembrane protein with metallophosphoesterase domain [Nocardia seriolae]OJF79314.1 metallophosphoesterase [Nocardia seriolae]PSK29214.1 metallophosphoesterase [Nocardia seriolae]QOW36790.1 metallophosphoesterase [Nocardia seriolae]QUN15691.1 metallophosphoesterase [Nocardia seriolae]